MIDILLIGVPAIILLSLIMVVIKNYRIADSNEVLVVTGKIADNGSAKTIHGGATFVWPIFQRYEYLDLSPMTIEINLKNALSKQNIRISVPSTFTIAIGTEPSLMGAAAERLLGKANADIANMARDIIFGQLRATIADMSIEEINQNRDKFISNIRQNVEVELRKIGLIVINVNITDISDESGYIAALGQKAASEAINQAKIDVANNDKNGEVGAAEAKREEKIKVAAAAAAVVVGENLAKTEIADSNAALKVRQEEALKRESEAEFVNRAQAEKAGYDANTIAEGAKALQERARLTALEIIPAEIAKAKLILDAEAKKQEDILAGEAEGNALAAKLKGEATGIQAILDAKAAGFKNIIASAGSAEAAAQLMIIELLPELTRIQVDAIKDIKIDKITVWEQGSGSGNSGSTANFLQSMVGFVPPMQELLNNSGMALPTWMAQDSRNAQEKIDVNEPAKESVVSEK